MTGPAFVAMFAWAWVACVAAFAVFWPGIDDTVNERVGLSAVAVGCLGASCRIWYVGSVSDGGFFMSLAFGYYASALVIKHWKTRIPYRMERKA